MSNSLTNQQKKDWAKMLFMQGQMQVQDIATKVDVSRQSLSRWIKDGNWELMRAAMSTTREDQIRNLYMQMAEINRVISERDSKFASPAEADTINKISNAIQKMEGDYGIADIISVSKQMLTWLRKRNPTKAIELSDYFDEFVKEKLK
ncbi:MAG: DDE transposase family protein [Bacteroides graminisolvens]|uniref:DDE transposase family protein n=1 Tax=Bacteroides graminisolvens TaxID=477666 RepID=UPI003A871FCA